MDGTGAPGGVVYGVKVDGVIHTWYPVTPADVLHLDAVWGNGVNPLSSTSAIIKVRYWKGQAECQGEDKVLSIVNYHV
jgi:hypothetical protein